MKLEHHPTLASPPLPGPPSLPRFTLDGDEGLEEHLRVACERALSGIRGLVPAASLDAVILGGGYGRGEGGVMRGSGGDRPFNDMEFYVVVSGSRHLNEARYHRALEALGAILTHLSDVEVEFKVTSLAELRTGPVSMFGYDLASGHRLLWGHPPDFGNNAHPLAAGRIPPSEAARLMMNRATGLLLSSVKLMRRNLAPSDAAFIRRNIEKAALACGDAVLTSLGGYDQGCRERHRRLEGLAITESPDWRESLVRHHRSAVGYKLHPDPRILASGVLSAMHAEVSELSLHCWLWLERRRLGRSFATAREYSRDPADKWPGTSVVRNAVLNLRADGLRLRPNPARHPRQRALESLALLLWDPAAALGEELAKLQRDLRTSETSYPGLVGAYESLWLRCR